MASPGIPSSLSADGATLVVLGTVEHGDHRGRRLGFPTANVNLTDAAVLDGVYAGTVRVDPSADGALHVAAVSVGRRPTYYRRSGRRLLEAHLLDFVGDLYGRDLRIELHAQLRPQRTYADTPGLLRQLRLDVEATRAWALTNGLDRLLAAARERARARRRVGRAGTQDHSARMRARRALRSRLIAEAVAEAGPGLLSHAWVAQRTGVPLGYLTWRFPTLADLASARAEAAADRRPPTTGPSATGGAMGA